jgi:hypothetical protein
MSERSHNVQRVLAGTSAALLPLLMAGQAMAGPHTERQAAHYTPPHPKTDPNGCVYDSRPQHDWARRAGAVGAIACYEEGAHESAHAYIEIRRPGGDWRVIHGLQPHASRHHTESTSREVVRISDSDSDLYRRLVNGNRLRVEVFYQSSLSTIGHGEVVTQPITVSDVSPMAQH